MESKIKRLTNGEEDVMQVLWSLGEAFCADIVACFKEPKPKYTTVATFIKLVERKGFVAHRRVGKGYLFRPIISREEYAALVARRMLDNYFGGSVAHFAAFMAAEEGLSADEFARLKAIVDKGEESFAKEASSEE